ncbi:MAG: DNA-binding response regulator [Cycloclasticus sp.]|jgi:DNA-binding NarL/FixJ family response regulator|nr:DNA-binding response regulator [Cycloclasticus sp.]
MIDILIVEEKDQIQRACSQLGPRVSVCDSEMIALSILSELSSPIVLLNHNVMKNGTPEYIKMLFGACSSCKIIVIGDALSEKEILSCLLVGARGYQQLDQLQKYSSRLVEAVDTGEAWITRRMTALLLDTLRNC